MHLSSNLNLQTVFWRGLSILVIHFLQLIFSFIFLWSWPISRGFALSVRNLQDVILFIFFWSSPISTVSTYFQGFMVLLHFALYGPFWFFGCPFWFSGTPRGCFFCPCSGCCCCCVCPCRRGCCCCSCCCVWPFGCRCCCVWPFCGTTARLTRPEPTRPEFLFLFPPFHRFPPFWRGHVSTTSWLVHVAPVHIYTKHISKRIFLKNILNRWIMRCRPVSAACAGRFLAFPIAITVQVAVALAAGWVKYLNI